MVGGMHDRGPCMAGGMCGGQHAWQEGMRGRGAFMAGGMHGRGWQGGCMPCMLPPADTTRYGDTVNERAVCILLECILVLYFYC